MSGLTNKPLGSGPTLAVRALMFSLLLLSSLGFLSAIQEGYTLICSNSKRLPMPQLGVSRNSKEVQVFEMKLRHFDLSLHSQHHLLIIINPLDQILINQLCTTDCVGQNVTFCSFLLL